MTVYLFNVQGQGRPHHTLYTRPEDEDLQPFFDLELSGPQAKMVPTIKRDTECIVASYAADRANVVFATYKFVTFENRATNENPTGTRYRVFMGMPDTDHPAEVWPKRKATALPRYMEFFNSVGNFKGRSAFQRRR
jgi:hypothetical protein